MPELSTEGSPLKDTSKEAQDRASGVQSVGKDVMNRPGSTFFAQHVHMDTDTS
jgi:hypothetical protein